ncbi:MAG: phosphoribosylglycinamide formyltransferase [Neomegalonema sp.]|nr:phosphoribosylglycinamide formyltransferase [Neomegalonema sp.]
MSQPYTPERPARIAILISGRGSNMVALAKALMPEEIPAEIVLVGANKPDAGGLAIAQGLGLPTASIDQKAYRGDKPGFDAALDAMLAQARPDLICLAGFMRILTPWLVERWAGKMLNIHPSLLPAFKGLDTDARAIAAGARLHGASVHEVTADLDDGPIIAQVALRISESDTPDTLAERLLIAEHRLFPAAVCRHLGLPAPKIGWPEEVNRDEYFFSPPLEAEPEPA